MNTTEIKTTAQATEIMTGKGLETFDLFALISQLKESMLLKDGHRSTTLLKAKSMKMVLMVMKAGEEILPHKAKGLICVNVFEGHLKFKAGRASVSLTEGQMAALAEDIEHSMVAVSDTVFLLTMGMPCNNQK